MHSKYFLILFFISPLVFSCIDADHESVSAIIQITSPRSDWNYFENRVVQLSLNVRSNAVVWYSDYDGFLGVGNGLFVSLRRGSHTIEAHYNNSIYPVSVEIKQDTVDYLEERRYLLTSPAVQINLLQGVWYPSLVTLEGTAAGLHYGNPEPKPHESRSALSQRSNLRDFHVSVDNLQNLRISQKSRAVLFRSYSIGDQKMFYVLNTADPMDEPHEILGQMIASGSRYTIWRDNWADIDQIVLDECIDYLNNIIIPRLLTIWGEWVDVDGDGKVAILFSPTINQEKTATGFFYPKDLFSVGNDPDEPSYNPDSNEMDIIYVAYPRVGDPNYNPRAIAATIAHELTHLITFSQKTFNKIAAGNLNANRETIFLEEGWSHLSENLCGFGVSGGNIMFLKQFLDDTASYSFCTPNVMGQSDSVGMRGAVCLFMSWLFWRQGGMDWGVFPRIVYDRGGVSFLRQLISSDAIGWPSIGQAAGKTMDELFLEFVYDMNKQRVLNTVYEYRTDPYTNEPVEFYNNMGVIVYQKNPYTIAVGALEPANIPLNTLPWSFFLIEPMTIPDDSVLPINIGYSLGKILFSMVKGNW